MKTYQIVIDGVSYFFKTNATVSTVQQAINFVEHGEVTLDKVLVAIRMLGGKATPVTIAPEETFVAHSAPPVVEEEVEVEENESTEE